MAGRQRGPPGCESSCLGAQMPDDMRLLFREQTNAFAWLACWATDSCLTEIKNVTRGTAASAEGFTFSRNGFGKVPRSRIWPLIYSPRTRTWVNCCRSPGSGGRAADTQRDPLSGPSPQPRFRPAGPGFVPQTCPWERAFSPHCAEQQYSTSF